MKIIRKIRRQIFIDDFDLNKFYLEGDGPVEIAFEDGTFLSFYSDTSNCNVVKEEQEMRKYGDSYRNIDISNFDLIKSLIGKNIEKIISIEYGYSLIFDDKSKMSILYRSTEEHFDSIYLKLL